MKARTLITLLFTSMCISPVQAAGVIDQPLSYTRPLGDLVFVMLGSTESEDKLTDPKLIEEFRKLRVDYPKSGLYHSTTHAPVWTIDDGVFTHHDYAYLSADGVYFVRLEGDWYQTKDFTGGKRLPPEEEQKLLDGTAVSFFKNGKFLRRYTVRELIVDTEALPHTPKHVLWTTGGILNEVSGKFLLDTQDSYRLTFDYKTGEQTARLKLGMDNPLNRIIVTVSLSITLCLLGIWAIWVYRTERARKLNAAKDGTSTQP